MQFGLISADTIFSFSDPTMAAGAIYGFLWLFLAAMALALRGRRTHFPNFMALSICALLGLFAVIRFAVMGLINMFLPINVSLGMLSNPPLWFSAAGIMAGLLIGWTVSLIQGKAKERGTRLNSGDEGPRAGCRNIKTALVLSLFFPGMGQVYYGHYLMGLIAFLALCLFSGLFHIWGFIVGFLLIQTATVGNKTVSRLIDGLTNRTRPG